MQLKEFQIAILNKLKQYVEALEKTYKDENILVQHHKKEGKARHFQDFCKKAWEQLIEENKIPIAKDKHGHPFPYINVKDGIGNTVPNVCLKVPTGGGKTLIALHALYEINIDYFKRNTGFILWIVPTEAIYRQTLQAFKNIDHPYKDVLAMAAGGRGNVKILEKTSALSLQDVQDHLCVMLLMLPSANRDTKESLKVFKNSGQFVDFFPPSDHHKANNQLLDQISNLDYEGDLKQNFGGVKNISIKHSLGNALRIVRPIVILDEGHRAYSQLARKTISTLNPRFILELSATPNMKEHKSNVLVSVSGVRLKEENMIKIPINISNSEKSDWKKTLHQAYEKLKELKTQAKEFHYHSRRYIRPIMLIQVERTGKEQKGSKFIHAEDTQQYLINHLGINPASVRIKTSGRNELKDEDLLSDASPVEYIITNRALQEGWDCPFAYVLAILGKSESKQALTQLIGRILRQPHTRTIKEFPDLNESYVFCYNRIVKDVVEDIKKGLQKEGMDDVIDQIKYKDHQVERKIIPRRNAFQKTTIFLPRVLYKQDNKWRNIIYESDILQNINYSQISYSQKETITPDYIQSLKLKTDIIKVDIEEPQGQLEMLESQRQSHIASLMSMDFSLMSKRLCHFIPNPIEASRILDEVIQTLQSQGISHQDIYLNRNFLLNKIENDIKDQVSQLSEQLFISKLKEGLICFKIFKDNIDLNWTMDQEMSFHNISDQNRVLSQRDGSPLQLSLFDRTYEKHYNTLEKQVAWYLDEHQAIKWWHRMVARQSSTDYHLQGWQKRKIWPDFLAYAVSQSKGQKYVILETKGEHLKGNDDTQYKKKLFKLLEQYHKDQSMDVGSFEVANQLVHSK